jgi:flagellar biosynthesis/type III secretory pathway protein FliH
MTFSSSPLPLPAFVEQPLPGAGFVPARTEVDAAAEPAAAAEDAAAALARAEEAGYARGLAAGRAQAEADGGERLRAAFEAALAGLRERERRQSDALAQAGLSLALAAAKHVLRRELGGDLDALAPCLAEAFAALEPEAELVLALSPADLVLVREGGAEAVAGLAARWNAQLVSDPTLGDGEARVEASGAQIELVLDAVLARLEAALRERLAAPERLPSGRPERLP